MYKINDKKKTLAAYHQAVLSHRPPKKVPIIIEIFH